MKIELNETIQIVLFVFSIPLILFVGIVGLQMMDKMLAVEYKLFGDVYIISSTNMTCNYSAMNACGYSLDCPDGYHQCVNDVIIKKRSD